MTIEVHGTALSPPCRLVYVTCEVCSGKRYNRETLEIKYKGKNIAEVLDMSVSQALNFFENIPQVFKKLSTLKIHHEADFLRIQL